MCLLILRISSIFNFCFSLYPGDLYAFTRRPTFLIVDSDNSSAYGSFGPNTSFEQPLVVLMSPQDVPSTFRGETAPQTTAGIPSTSREQPSNEKLINIGYGNYKFIHKPLTNQSQVFPSWPTKQKSMNNGVECSAYCVLLLNRVI